MTGTLDGAHAKYARAMRHLQDLQAACREHTARPDAFTFKQQFDRLSRSNVADYGLELHQDIDVLGVINVSVEAVAPVDPAISLLAGDALNNFRGALDYAAWECVTAGATTIPVRPHQVKFPIVDDATKWDRIASTALPGIAVDPLAVIRRWQPFECASGPRDRGLHWLAHISGREKHRRLSFVSVGLHDADVRVVRSDGFKVLTKRVLLQGSRVLEPGLGLVQLVGVVGDAHQTQVWVQPMWSGGLSIAGDDDRPAILVSDVMTAISTEVATILDELEALLP